MRRETRAVETSRMQLGSGQLPVAHGCTGQIASASSLDQSPHNVIIHIRVSGRVAQMVEQWTENPRAEGSSPPPTTTNEKASRIRLAFFHASVRASVSIGRAPVPMCLHPYRAVCPCCVVERDGCSSEDDLQASCTGPVFRLGARETVEFQLVDQAAVRERGILQIALGLLGRLGVPIRTAVVRGPYRILVRELIELELLDQAVMGERGVVQVTLGFAEGVLLAGGGA